VNLRKEFTSSEDLAIKMCSVTDESMSIDSAVCSNFLYIGVGSIPDENELECIFNNQMKSQ